MTERDVEALAEMMRGSRLSWGTHADRWTDTGWQAGFWREVAQVAFDWYVERVEEAHREGAAEVEAIAREAINSIGGRHNHWREGGQGGACRTCDDETQIRDRLRAALGEVSL